MHIKRQSLLFLETIHAFGLRASFAARAGMEAQNSCSYGAGKDSKAAAEKALKTVKKGSWKRERKERFSVVFHRPKTLKLSRTPKYPKIR